MSARDTVAEFRTDWLPHVTDAGLRRLVELLDSGSPLLIHGAFTRACAMGCLATHIAWHHPATRTLNDEAGVCWLTRIAGLNPATSRVILAWDRGGAADWPLRSELLRACRDELAERVCQGDTSPAYNDDRGVIARLCPTTR
jgi:hypothetical protein